ncbi:hypothetical protein [Brachybacterium sp. GPGPB12]|uniref:hypothetical protein n=1 Tax=Brachybacterium sp. GPGPB12 TaxID=3023517 RepID=UPI0031343E8D
MPTTPAHASYLRHPDVRGELITFTAANDVWLAPLEGGRAWRLTDEGAPVSYPRFSPDGARIAFTSRASGGPEVWVADVAGESAPRRLTFWGRPTTKVVGWSPDGRIVATTSYAAPVARDAQLWAVDLEGTTTRRRWAAAARSRSIRRAPPSSRRPGAATRPPGSTTREARP